MKALKTYATTALLVFYIFWAIVFELTNEFVNFFEGKFLISADELPNQIYSIVNMHTFLMPLILLAYVMQKWSTLKLYKTRTAKELSNEESSVGVIALLLILVFIPMITYFSSYAVIQLSIMTPILIVLAYHRVFDKTLLIAVQAKISSFVEKDETKSPSAFFVSLGRAFAVMALFFGIVSAAFNIGVNTTSQISLIGDKSLMLTPPSCVGARLKPVTCNNAADTSIANGNLIMLSAAYDAHPPTSVSQIYYEAEMTLKNAYALYEKEQWADSIEGDNTYRVLKNMYIDNREEHDMTLLQFKKAIESGQEKQFVYNLGKNKRGGLLLNFFLALYPTDNT